MLFCCSSLIGTGCTPIKSEGDADEELKMIAHFTILELLGVADKAKAK